jgi:hypothetical protein
MDIMKKVITKYHPILFSTPMVQAIQQDRKKQTRRTKGLEKVNQNPDEWKYDGLRDDFDLKDVYACFKKDDDAPMLIKCPYNIGDALWVRETSYKCLAENLKGVYYYKASIHSGWDFKWKPSIFMPKEACRIFLKIKSIRVERLQEISEEDSIAEGAKDRLKYIDLKTLEALRGWNIPRPFGNHQFGFLALWCSINGCENWLQNPFVWVYEFEQIEKPLDFIS